MAIQFKNAPSYSVDIGHVRIETDDLIRIIERCDAERFVLIENENAQIEGLKDVKENPEYLLGCPTVTLRDVRIIFNGGNVRVVGLSNDDQADRFNVQHVKVMLTPFRSPAGRLHDTSLLSFPVALVGVLVGVIGSDFGMLESYLEGRWLIAAFLAVAVGSYALWIGGVFAVRYNVYSNGSRVFWRIDNPLLSASIGAVIGSTLTYILG